MTRMIRLLSIFLSLSFFSFIILSFTIPIFHIPSSYAHPESLSSLSFSEIIKEIDIESISKHVRYFSNLSSRVTGYPGFYSAAEYIYNYFQELGLSVHYQEFDVAVPKDYGANITIMVDGKPLRVITAYNLWPNLFQTCPTPPEGLSGRLVYLGDDISYFAGKKIEGSIALMDFNSGILFKKAFELGAKAVVFIAPEDFTRPEAEVKVYNIPIYAPRLLISREDGKLLKEFLKTEKEVSVKISSTMRYESAKALNVIAILEGSDPSLFPIGISAYYDSLSYIPSLSPGAEESLGVSTILELARFFKKHTPLRTIYFIAFAGHHQALKGARSWVEAQVATGAAQFEVPILLSLDYNSEVRTLGAFPADTFYQIGGQEYFEAVPDRNKWLDAYIHGQIIPRMVEEIGFSAENFPQVSLDPSLNAWDMAPPICDVGAHIIAGGAGMGLRSVRAFRLREFTPSDVAAYVNYLNLLPQLQASYCIISSLANLADIPLHSEVKPTRAGGRGGFAEHWGFGVLEGRAVIYNKTTAWYDPLPNAIVVTYVTPLSYSIGRLFGENWFYDISIADSSGRFTIYGLRPTTGTMLFAVEVYKVNWSTGEITHAPDLGQFGSMTFPNRIELRFGGYGTKDNPAYFVAFQCSSIALYGLVDPTTLKSAGLYLRVYEFGTHSEPLTWGTTDLSTTRPPCLIAKRFTLSAMAGGGVMETGEALAFVPPNKPVEILVFTTYYPNPIAVLANVSSVHPWGVGYTLKSGGFLGLALTPYEGAYQLYNLVDQRSSIFTSYGVVDPRLEYFNSRAMETLNETFKERTTLEYDRFVADAYKAWSYTISSYHVSRELTYDCVNSIIFFYFLLLPSTFLAERLLFPQEAGKRRLFAVLFTFALFSMSLAIVHPGFLIAFSPIMMILGFTIVALSIPVIIMIAGRLTTTIGALRSRILGPHYAEISRVSAMLSAFSIGIANMRRRRFRTFLTFLSIILIISALVSFTSTYPVTITRAKEWSKVQVRYPGILVRDVPWGPLPDETVMYLYEMYKDKAIISPRLWFYGAGEAGEILVENLDGEGRITVAAVLGLTNQEENVTGISKQILIDGLGVDQMHGFSVMISSHVAHYLNATIGSRLRIFGLTFYVTGIFDGKPLDEIRDLDLEPITPRDFSIPAPPGGGEEVALAERVPHIGGNRVLIIPYDTASHLKPGSALRAGVYSIAIKFGDYETVRQNAEEFALLSRLPFYAGIEADRTRLYMARKAWATTGFEIMLMPIAISLFIVLNLMLGAVAERVREVGTYSSVGLSPMHVAGMFFAESLVYGILGAIIGYIAGVALIRTALTFKFFPGALYPNFTSLPVVLFTSLSILTTTLATIYPMLKASTLVTPSVERKWKMPTKPIDERTWSVPMPFSFSQEDSPAILIYLGEYFSQHTVTPTGSFLTMDTGFEKETLNGKEIKVLRATVKLRPFDQGIVQTVKVIPTGKERATFHVFLHREAGFFQLWRVSNRSFLSEVRQQLLLWSSLREADRKRYRDLAKEG